MKKLSFIIENFTDSEDYRELIEAAKASGRDCFVIDKRHNLSFDAADFKQKSCVLFMGSIGMGRHVKEALSHCSPVLFCTEDKYLCSKYYPIFLPYLFNDKHIATTVGNLKQDRWKYYAEYGKEAIIFIRPDRGDKIFSGQLLDLQDFDRFWGNNIVFNGSDQDVVYVSTPKNIVGEWRFVVSKDKIIAKSTYVYQGQRTWVPAAPQGAIDLVNKLLTLNYYPDPVFCFDICQDGDGGFWLLELTSFSAAGLYACNKTDIIREVCSIIEGT